MTRITGGCQCGAVRYALSATPTGVSLCHCRMCQKATGGLFLAAGNVELGQIEWTRGAPASFRSSSLAERGFCRVCGTPLTFRYVDRSYISVTLGSLDVPEAAAPAEQLGIEARVAWWSTLADLPARSTDEDAPGLAAQLRDYQHPDHDTPADWQPAAVGPA